MFRRKDAVSQDTVPDQVEAALKHLAAGEAVSAIAILTACIKQAPNEAQLWFLLAEAHVANNDKPNASIAYKEYLARDVMDVMRAGPRLFALDRSTSDKVISMEYVEKTFDDYAFRFETTLVGALNYKVPVALAETVKAYSAGPFARILDLGCGTGLCSTPFEGQGIIEGVDVSTGMLNKASEKGIFNELHRADVVTFLKETSSQYDLVLCGDVLIYIGVPDETFHGVAKVLTPNGLFAFSIQKLTEGEIILGSDRRFWHSHDYIDRALRASGLNVEVCKETTLRLEEGEGVPGLIFVVKKI